MAGPELIVGAFLSSFFQVTLDRLASSDFLRGSKREGGVLKKLELTVNSINHVLDDAEKKQYQSPSVKKWLDELKHAAYETDQLLDEIAADAELKKLKAKFLSATSKVRGFFSAFTSNPFESRINELFENLEFLAKQMKRLGLGKDTHASREGGVIWNPPERLLTSSLVDPSGNIYGRDVEKKEIIKYLLSDNVSGNDRNNQVPIISIVGIGGMGKSTLAQLVVNDQRIKEQFEPIAWVHVSDYFNVVRLTKAILESFKCSADAGNFTTLQKELEKTVSGKKYLLVLDDIWNLDWVSWEALHAALNYGSPGSRILVTTRDKEVVSVMNSAQKFELNGLEENDCWSLFKRHAFHDNNVSDYPYLESNGKKIAEICEGSPLYIKLLVNLFRTKPSEQKLDKILRTDTRLLLSLRLNYLNLPSNLKRCFAYCSMFPKGYKFEKDELIKLWMAEGLLNGVKQMKVKKKSWVMNPSIGLSIFHFSNNLKAFSL